MVGSLLILMEIISLSSLQRCNYSPNTPYYTLPKFWTNTGFCPSGEITHYEIKKSLFADAMQMNLLHISALPRGAITHIRIHWLLELLKFEKFSQSGAPMYDFSFLDKFLMGLDQINLIPNFEFMANLSDLFIKNPTQNSFYWENLSYQLTNHYFNMFGEQKLMKWRFETWNEPDSRTYNKLNFSVKDYLLYIKSLNAGLQIAAMRAQNILHLHLRGPAGLFKSISNHPLCWSLLDYCNQYIEKCPIEILTYHRKGTGENGSTVLNGSKLLLTEIYKKYPNIKKLKISNDESDPIFGWSTPRDFQTDVRYAATLINIILDHWNAKLNNENFSNLETISHDNAFLSFHPHEFCQRTLLAHFRMNKTIPPHSQFIQKPVYAALGLLSRLADLASDVMTIETGNMKKLKLLKSVSAGKDPLYYSWLFIPTLSVLQDERNYINLPCFQNYNNKIYAFIIEYIDQVDTNPAKVWFNFNSPPYPNIAIREAMRRQQSPRILTTGVLSNTSLSIDFSKFEAPWIMLLRICSILKQHLKTPFNLILTPVTHNEVFVTWQEVNAESVQCLKTYEVWFRVNITQRWVKISSGWHLPHPSFQFAPSNGLNVNGFYKVRAVDIFNNTSLFSTQEQYIEI